MVRWVRSHPPDGNIHYADGRVVADQAFFDTADVRQQLGLTFPAVLLTLPQLARRAVLNRL